MPSHIIKINGTSIFPGERAQVSLNTYRLPSHTVIDIPVHVFRSKKPGPTVLFSAGMHGDETNGIEIIRQLLKERHFEKIFKGTIIVIPIINIVSFINGTRELPDGKDLNRSFPGSKTGSLGSRIAKDLMTQIIPQIDFGIDFHTGGSKINNYPQMRCVFDNRKNIQLAKMFGAPFVVNSPYREKSLRKEAEKLGKHILVYEAGESLRFSSLAIKEGLNGCLRMLSNLRMIKTHEAPKSMSIALKNSRWVRAKASGLFRTTKKYGSFVEKNQVIGTISGPFGDMEMELISPEYGFIIGINNQPVVNEGDALIHIGVE